MQVRNLMLEVLLGSLIVSQSMRVTVTHIFTYVMQFFCIIRPDAFFNLCSIKCINWLLHSFKKVQCIELAKFYFIFLQEISLGILGNLACHEIPMKQIASTDKLIEIVVDQLFLDDTSCLCEACR